jgi:hypothetical protein
MARRLCIREVSSSFQRIITILRSRQHQTHGVVDDPRCRMYILVRLSRSCHLLVDIPCFKLISSASTKPLPVLGPSKNPTIVYLPLLFGFLFFSLRRSNTYIIATHLLALRSSPVATRSKRRRRLVANGRIANDSRFVKDTWTNPFAPSGTLWRKAFYAPFVARHNFCPCCHILWSASHLPEKPSIRW